MYAKNFQWNNRFLAAIATAYTSVKHNRQTRIEWHDTQRWWGETQNDGASFVLRLSHWLPIVEVKFTFWHELAHLVLHPPPVRTKPGWDLRDVAEGKRMDPDNRWLANMEVFLKKREQEADDWTRRELAAYERQYGDFFRYAIRGAA